MRRLLLPAALLALSLAGCDSGALEPTGAGLQAHTNAPTASLLGSISGTTIIDFNCSAFYTYEGFTDSGSYFVITSGSQFATVYNLWPGYAEVQAGSYQGDFTLEFRSSAHVTLASRDLQVRSYGECDA